MLLSMLSLPRARTALSFRQRLGTYAWDRCGAGRDAKARMRRNYGKRNFFEMLVFPLLARKPAEEKGDTRRREWACVATWGGMGREEDFAGLYTLLPLPLASLVN